MAGEIEVNVNQNNNQVNLIQNTTNVVQVKSIGPQGPKGDTGAQGAVGIVTGSLFLTGSLTVSGSDSVVNLQEVQFDTNHSSSGHSTGRMFWDDNSKTVTLDMQGSNVRLQIGQEEHVYAKNNSGVTINNGDAVRISGAQGANVTITKAVSGIQSFKTAIEQDQILGLATEQIADNQSGYITTFGSVRDLDTSAFSEGDILYLSHLISGSYTNIRPPAPCFEARVGIVQIANATEGVILVNRLEPTFLSDISQVTSSGVIPNEKTYLVYDDSTDLISFTNEFSGSFSGSFSGDGSGLSGIVADGTLSSSAQIATDISGAFTEASGGFSTRITTLETQDIFSGSFSGSFSGDGSGLSGISGGAGLFYNETITHPATLSATSTAIFNVSVVTRNMPFVLQADTNFTKIHIRVGTASSGNGVFGLYKWDGNTGQTFEKVYEESTLFNLAVSGVQTITLTTPQVLTAGDVYIPIVLLQNNTQLYTISNSGLGTGILGRAADFTNYFNVLESYTSYSVPMPNNISFSIVNSQFAAPTLLTLKNA